MPPSDAIDLAEFQSHLDVIYHNRPTSFEPDWLDMFEPPRNAIGTPGATVTLEKGLSDQPQLSPPAEVEGADAARPADAINAAEAASARSRLAQEALVANPGEMRKLFPVVLKDVGIKYGSHLDMADISIGLRNPQLPQADKDFLAVLQAGYEHFNRGTSAKNNSELEADPLGVSANSLAILDKSLNRNNPDDPLHRHDLELGWIDPFIMGANAGALLGRLTHVEPRTGMIMAGVGAFGSALTYELSTWGGSKNETQSYDHLKSDYQSFLKDFEKGQTLTAQSN